MKLKILAFVAILGAGFALASCETMSAEECAAADWHALGYADADRNGSSRFADRAEDCAKKGITADADAYGAGFGNGMRSFCQPNRAFAFARGGGTFAGACPDDLQNDFQYAYSDGQRVHEAQEALDQARSRVSSAESRRNQIDEDLHDREAALQQATTDEERNRLRGEIDRLRRQRRDANDDIRTAQDAIPGLMRVVDDLRYELASRYGSW